MRGEAWLLAALTALLLWQWDHPLLWPLRINVVLLHEAGHALATWLTGGTVLEIGLSWREGGHTLSAGGLPLVVLNAGYLGSLLGGLGLLAAARGRDPRGVCRAVGATAALLALVLVRPVLGFGFPFTVAVALGWGLLGRRAPEGVVRFALRAFGTFSVLYAFGDIAADVFGGAGRSDAHLLAERTGVPAAAWGLAWMAAGAAAVLAFARGGERPRRRP